MALPPEIICRIINAAELNYGGDWLLQEHNIPVSFDTGDLVLFEGDGHGAYEVHFLFVGKARQSIDHAKLAFKIMFEDHGAELIFGLVPAFRHETKLMARWVGGKSSGIRQTINGPCELFVLSRAMWKGKD